MACDREDSQDVSRPLCNAFTYPDRKSTGKKKGRWTTLGWRARKDCSLQTNALNLQVHSLLLMIPEMWLVIIRVNRGSENFFYNYCSNIFSFVSSCWHFSCFSSPHLWHYSRPANIHSAGLQTSTKRSGCAPLLICGRKICQYNGNL